MPKRIVPDIDDTFTFKYIEPKLNKDKTLSVIKEESSIESRAYDAPVTAFAAFMDDLQEKEEAY